MRSVSIISAFAAVLLLCTSAIAQQGNKIVIGVVPEVNLVKQMDRFVPLSNYLDKKTGYDIEIRPMSNYGQLYEEFRDGNIDGGFFGSLVYGIAKARVGIMPLVRPVSVHGRSTYSGLIFVRKDSGIKKPEDMRGKTIALADPATSASYLAQKGFLASHGISIDRDMKIIWTGSHEAAIRAVLSQQADVGGAKDTVVARLRRENRVFDTVIEILRDDERISFPDNTLAMRKSFPQEKAQALKNCLLKMNSDPEAKTVLSRFGASRFVPAKDEDFKPMYDMIRNLKIDLTNYPYKRHDR